MHNNGKLDHNDVDGKTIEHPTAYLITFLIMSKHWKPTQFFVLLKNCNLIWNGLWQIIFLCSERTLKIGNFDSIFPRRLITSNDLESLHCSIISTACLTHVPKLTRWALIILKVCDNFDETIGIYQIVQIIYCLLIWQNDDILISITIFRMFRCNCKSYI